jgi:hypothetical protein
MIFGAPFEGIPGWRTRPRGFAEDVASDISRVGDAHDELIFPLLRGAGEGPRPL